MDAWQQSAAARAATGVPAPAAGTANAAAAGIMAPSPTAAAHIVRAIVRCDMSAFLSPAVGARHAVTARSQIAPTLRRPTPAKQADRVPAANDLPGVNNRELPKSDTPLAGDTSGARRRAPQWSHRPYSDRYASRAARRTRRGVPRIDGRLRS